jgi:hypothetical protein
MTVNKKLDFLLNTLNQRLFELQNRPFNNAEITLLRGIWESQTYNQIAQKKGYSPDYLTNVVAPELCRRLSDLIGKRITKKNCRVLLESYAIGQTLPKIASPLQHSDAHQNMSPCYPSGPIPLNSSFYIERSAIESQLYEEIAKPGALVRIKAPNEMGKTSLILRILDYSNRLGYHKVNLNLEQIEQTTLKELNRFLRWLCANVSHHLNLEPKLDEYWDEDLGSKVSCTFYFQNYLLKQIDSPLVLVVDNLHHIFEYSLVAKDFLPLLRSWYEETKRSSMWQKLRLVVSHSTEIYIPLEMNQSPFNVGLPIQLGNFSIDEVLQLAQRYKLNWIDEEKTRQLMTIIGGNPALVNLGFYHLSRGEITFAQLLEIDSISTKIYAYHLQRHWITLEKQPELMLALCTVMNTNKPVPLEPVLAHKLSSLGLIELLGSKAIPSCELYRQYFTKMKT